jgi:hypothetical protein
MSSTAAHTDTEKAKSKNKEVKRPSWLDIDNLDDGDMSKMGYVMDKETQAKWDAPPPNYLNKTVAEKLWLVTVRFPHHWVKHNLYCLPLVVVSLVPLVVGTWHSRCAGAFRTSARSQRIDIRLTCVARPFSACLSRRAMARR